MIRFDLNRKRLHWSENNNRIPTGRIKYNISDNSKWNGREI